jgi:uncharacterized cupin superfamily protein
MRWLSRYRNPCNSGDKLEKEIVRLSAAPDGFGRTPDALEGELFVSELPVQHTHLYYEDEEQGLYVGVWDTTTMTEAAGAYGCEEFMWLLEGEVEIKNSKTGAMEKVKAGEAFVIPRGYDCQWQQSGYLRKFFVISERPGEEGPTVSSSGIIKLNNESGQENSVSYKNIAGDFIAGSWHRDSFESNLPAMDGNHFVYVQEGSFSVAGEDTTLHTFVAGEAFFVPKGARCRWSCGAGSQAFYATVK